MRLDDFATRFPRAIQLFAKIKFKIHRKWLAHSGWPIMAYLYLKNRCANGSIVGDIPITISLTSYGKRTHHVHFVIWSLCAGKYKASEIELWLDDAVQIRQLNPHLVRLANRGLQIRQCENFGPYKKFYPHVSQEMAPNKPLATFDDDTLYPRKLVAQLYSAYCNNPTYVNCLRAHRIAVDGDGIAPYVEWPQCATDTPSLLHFATGVSGVIYPVSFQLALRRRGSSFMRDCPGTDDVWLHSTAMRTATEVRQMSSQPREFPSIPMSQANNLWRINVGDKRNDANIAALYGPEDVSRLKHELAIYSHRHINTSWVG